MKPVPYDERFDPPAPVLPLRLRIPEPRGWLRLVGLVDTGADITLVPGDVAERHLPVAGSVGIRGVTGDVQRAVLYRAEIAVGSSRCTLLLAGFGLEVVVGRDLLNHLNLDLQGPARVLRVVSVRDTPGP